MRRRFFLQLAAALPVEQPTRFELVVNLGVRAAMGQGITIPQSILLRADRVLE
jgi:hypothetical protein